MNLERRSLAIKASLRRAIPSPHKAMKMPHPPTRIARSGEALERALGESEARFKVLTTLSADWYWEQDEQLRFVARTAGRGEAQGLRPHPDIGKHRCDLPIRGVSAEQWCAHKEVLNARKPFRDFEYEREYPDGIHRESISGEPVFDEEGRFKGYRGVGREVTASRLQESLLLRLRAAVDATADGLHIIDCEAMRLVDVNESACRDLGYARDEFLSLSIQDIAPIGLSTEDLVRLHEHLFSVNEHAQLEEIANRHKDGSVIPMEIHRRGIVIDGRRFVVSVIRDIRQRKADEKRLQESEARFRALTNLSADWYWEQDENLRYVERAGGKDSAATLRPSEDTGKLRWELTLQGVSEEQWAIHKATLAERKPFHNFECYRVLESGRRYVSVSGEPIFDELGRFKGYRGIGRDITERRSADERIEYLAFHDSLTALPNRANFSQILNHAIRQSFRFQRRFAVLFIDLDHFKNINDTLGHEAGDVLLCEISRRLKECLRTSDTVARLGGDEFVVLVEDVTEPKCVATVARKILSAVIKPMVLKGQDYQVTASVGVCMYPEDAQDEQSLMKNADIAMYRAKEEGKNTYHFYSEKIDLERQEK